MSELSLWFPLFLIFASALLAAIIKRYTKDPCLRVFHRSFVFLKLRDGRWMAGNLIVYSNSLEVEYREPEPLGDAYEKLTCVLYEHNLERIDRVLRPSPLPGTPGRLEWEQEIERLRHPSFSRRVRRKFRNGFNMLRDAFAQAILVIFGTFRRRTRLAAVPVDEGKVGEMSRSLISVVPNAYEPILEKYLGRQVVMETTDNTQLFEQRGLLQEYSAKYILARDVAVVRDLPPCVSAEPISCRFDVIFPRQFTVVRYLAQKKAPALA